MILFRFSTYRWASDHPHSEVPAVTTLEAEGWVRIAQHGRWQDLWLVGRHEQEDPS
jgi:hypothetical protein